MELQQLVLACEKERDGLKVVLSEQTDVSKSVSIGAFDPCWARLDLRPTLFPVQ